MPGEGLAARDSDIAEEPSSCSDELADDESVCGEEDGEEEQPVQEASDPEEAEHADDNEHDGNADQSDLEIGSAKAGSNVRRRTGGLDIALAATLLAPRCGLTGA
eukprot:2348880-Karenia_brevis.AAC.1